MSPDPLRPNATDQLTIGDRVRRGVLIGLPLGLLVGVISVLTVFEERSPAMWMAFLAGGVFAFCTLGAFLGATSTPRRGDD